MDIDLSLWNVLGRIELENNQKWIKISITEIQPFSNTSISSVLDSLIILYQMSGKHYHFPQNMLELEKLREWRCADIGQEDHLDNSSSFDISIYFIWFINLYFIYSMFY